MTIQHKLTGNDKPGFCACALLTGEDLLQPPPSAAAASFFRVLIIYNRRNFTALRAYSSDTNRWSAEAARAKIDARRLRKLGQSVALRGVAFWPLRCSALAVRLDDPEPRELAMPPDGVMSDLPRDHRLLGVTTGGELSFTDVRLGVEDRGLRGEGPPCHSLVLMTKVLCPTTADDDDYDMSTSKLERQEQCAIMLTSQIKVRSCKSTVSLRWFCEKSGVILFTIGEHSSSPGAYALNIKTEEVEKLADGAACDLWRNVVGYEMDAAASLASIACY